MKDELGDIARWVKNATLIKRSELKKKNRIESLNLELRKKKTTKERLSTKPRKVFYHQEPADDAEKVFHGQEPGDETGNSINIEDD